MLEPNSQVTEAVPSQERKKLPMNAFNLWCRTARFRLMTQYPSMHRHEIGRRLGYEWHYLTYAEKKPYIEEAQRLKAKYLAEYLSYEYAERKKKELLQNQGFHPLPETLMASDARPLSNTSGVLQRIEYCPFWNSSPSGSCALRQSGAMQYPGLSSSHIQLLPRYGINSLHYNHSMPSVQSHVSSSATYYPAPPNTQQSSTAMDRGNVMSVVENEYVSSTRPVIPIRQGVFPGEIEDMIAVYLPFDDDD